MSDESGPEFVDSNILVYAYDAAAGVRHSRAHELIQSLWWSGEGCVSIQVLQEFYVTITRKAAESLSPDVAAGIVADMGEWHTHCPVPCDVLTAIRLHRRYHIAFWDAMILVSASHLGCGTLWSEDLNHGQSYNGVLVRNPFA